jgi:hypothetical protein
MKKIMLAALTASLFIACNSNDSTNDSGETTSGDKVSAVENVNGNIPDTTNTINLGGDKDTSATPDSAK